MPFLKHILFLSTTLALFACNQPAREVKTQVDWNDELLGFGHLSARLDSMGKQVMFVPKMKSIFNTNFWEHYGYSELVISGNTLKLNAAFTLMDVYQLAKIHKDSIECHYRPVKLWTNLYMFLKEDGMRFLPDVLFYRPLSAELDKRFEYLFAAMRYDRRNVAFIETLNSGLTLLFHGYLIDNSPHVLLLHRPEDLFVVRQMVQHTINTRMDPMPSYMYCGDGVPFEQQYLVYDKALYEHNDVSKLDMLGDWLFMYFEGHPGWQKVADSLHIQMFTEKVPKDFSNYPVVLKAPELWVMPPLPPPPVTPRKK